MKTLVFVVLCLVCEMTMSFPHFPPDKEMEKEALNFDQLLKELISSEEILSPYFHKIIPTDTGIFHIPHVKSSRYVQKDIKISFYVY